MVLNRMKGNKKEKEGRERGSIFIESLWLASLVKMNMMMKKMVTKATNSGD